MLAKIWDDNHIMQYKDNAGEKCINCLCCNNMFSNWHATKMAWHLLGIKGKGLAVCNEAIPPEQFGWYCGHGYYVGTTEKKEGRKRGADELMTALTERQADATRNLKSKYIGNTSQNPVKSCASVGGGQMTIDVGMEHASQLYIRKSNNAAMEMAIADFFHCENIPNQAVESSHFKAGQLGWKGFCSSKLEKDWK